jgi:hypothetical protein
MSTKQIHVFVSHAWAYSEHYGTLAEWIFETPWRFGQASLQFRNFSIPKDDPIHNAPTDAKLAAAIKDQISRSHVVVIPSGMYANYSKWIQKEISGALQLSKPIVAVVPRGQERNASAVITEATETVGWNRDSVVSAIWRHFVG